MNARRKDGNSTGLDARWMILDAEWVEIFIFETYNSSVISMTGQKLQFILLSSFAYETTLKPPKPRSHE